MKAQQNKKTRSERFSSVDSDPGIGDRLTDWHLGHAVGQEFVVAGGEEVVCV